MAGSELFSRGLRALRAAHSLDQEDVAKAVGVARPTVSSWETGGSSPTVAQFEKIAALFSLTPEEFFSAAEKVAR